MRDWIIDRVSYIQLRADWSVLILVVEGVLLFSLKIVGIRSAVLLRSARRGEETSGKREEHPGARLRVV